VGGKLISRALVEIEGDFVVSAAIVFQGQAEQGTGMIAIGLDGPLEQGHDLGRIAADGRDTGAALVEIVGRLLDRARQVVENRQRAAEVAGHAGGLGPGQSTGVGIVAGLEGGGVIAGRGVELFEGHGRLAHVELGQGTAIARFEGFQGDVIATEQEVANAESDGGGGAFVFAGFEFGHRVAQHAELGKVLGDGSFDAVDFLRSEGTGIQDQLLQL
jgi:hypothetical protein